MEGTQSGGRSRVTSAFLSLCLPSFLPLGDTTQIGKCAFTRETDTLCGLSMPIMPPPSPDLTVISFPLLCPLPHSVSPR